MILGGLGWVWGEFLLIFVDFAVSFLSLWRFFYLGRFGEEFLGTFKIYFEVLVWVFIVFEYLLRFGGEFQTSLDVSWEVWWIVFFVSLQWSWEVWGEFRVTFKSETHPQISKDQKTSPSSENPPKNQSISAKTPSKLTLNLPRSPRTYPKPSKITSNLQKAYFKTF